MKTSLKSALFGLGYWLVAFISLVKGNDIFGYVMLLSAIVTLAASFICEAVEKNADGERAS